MKGRRVWGLVGGATAAAGAEEGDGAEGEGADGRRLGDGGDREVVAGAGLAEPTVGLGVIDVADAELLGADDEGGALGERVAERVDERAADLVGAVVSDQD